MRPNRDPNEALRYAQYRLRLARGYDDVDVRWYSSEQWRCRRWRLLLCLASCGKVHALLHMFLHTGPGTSKQLREKPAI